MRVSVILDTFEQPAWLEKALWGYAYQTRGDFEVVIADDGSGRETHEVVDCCRRKLGLDIQHVWQPREGFRKSRILNRAIEKSQGDYLIFTDGDCIPRRDFVATHVAQARLGAYLSGGVLGLPQSLSRTIGANDIASGHAFEWRWLLVRQCNWWRLRKVAAPRWFAAISDALTSTRASFNGHNSSAWRSDIESVNGFDERMQEEGLDRELGERLVNSGVRGRRIRYRAICLHLDHPPNYAEPEVTQFNEQIRWTTRFRRVIWTDHGMNSGAQEDEPVILPFPGIAAKVQEKRRAA